MNRRAGTLVSGFRDHLDRILIAAGVAFMLVGAGLIAWHPVLNLRLDPDVSCDAQGRTVWVIGRDDVVEQYREGDANWDGTMSEYADEYFVAHDWSDFGATIASEPDVVILDDREYAYDGTREAEVGDDLGDMRAWSNADGRIAFQTCTGEGDGVMVVRYRPVGDVM